MAVRTVVPRRRSQPRAQPVTVTEGDIGQLARSFERSLRAAHRSPATVRIYSISVAQLADCLAERRMPLVTANITREHIETWLTDLLERRSAGTAETRFRGAKAFFDWAVSEGEITASPMQRVKRPRGDETPPPILDDDQLRRLLATCNGKTFDERRDQALLRLLIDCGVRRSELAYLTLEDVDLDSNVIRVIGKADRGRGRTRVVPFGRKAAAALDRYLRVRAQHRHAGEQAMWLGRQGPLADGAVDLMLRRRARQAGLEGIHAHLARHRFAHEWLANGGQEQDLMQLAGWKSRTMLARYGASAADERAREAYRRRQSPGDRL